MKKNEKKLVGSNKVLFKIGIIVYDANPIHYRRTQK